MSAWKHRSHRRWFPGREWVPYRQARRGHTASRPKPAKAVDRRKPGRHHVHRQAAGQSGHKGIRKRKTAEILEKDLQNGGR